MATAAITTSTAPAAPTMSSREIAELVESRHDSVKRTMERLAEKGVIRLGHESWAVGWAGELPAALAILLFIGMISTWSAIFCGA